MSAAPISRAVLRQNRLLLRRNNFRQASTTAEAASKAQETGKQAVSKAQESGKQAVSKASEGLSRVQSSAGSAASSAGSAASRVGSSAYNAMSRIGGRTGRLISFVESLIPPTVYYGRVGWEVSRMVFRGQQMAPPSMAQVQSYFQPLTNVVRNPRSMMSGASSASSVTPESVLSSVRNVNRSQMATAGIIFAEILGFFTIGEMAGRMKIIGYHGEVHHEH